MRLSIVVIRWNNIVLPNSSAVVPRRCVSRNMRKAMFGDTYRFRGETVAGREPNNLMVEFRVFNVTKKIEVVYRLRKKAVTDPEAVYIAFPFEVEGGKIHLDVPGGSIEAGVDQIPGLL